MKILVHGDKLLVTKSIKEYLNDKMKKLDKFFDNPDNIKASINIKVKNNLQTIEVTVPMKHFVLRAEECHSDLYASIDLVLDKLEKQIRRHKDKLLRKYKDHSDFNMVLDFEAEEEALDIIKRKDLSIKPMDEEEAILQMQLVNHDFFVFKNVDEECVSVIYKRKTGKYGIINVK